MRYSATSTAIWCLDAGRGAVHSIRSEHTDKADLGVNLRAELENHIQLGIGGVFGLTGDSENTILRLVAGYEFD